MSARSHTRNTRKARRRARRGMLIREQRLRRLAAAREQGHKR